MNIPACPKCKSEGGVFVNVQFSGSSKAWFSTETGAYEETDNDPMKVAWSKVVRCADCGKPRRDLCIEGSSVKVR